MTSLNEKLYKLFRCAAELTEALWHSAIDPAHVSPKQLADHVSALCGVQFEYAGVDVETDHIFGHIERYEDGKTAKIYVVTNSPERYHVPIIAKELCQILLDSKEDWKWDGSDTLQRLAGQIIEYDAPENVAVRSEELAERLSWEILYPYELRLTDLAEGLSVEAIATKRRLPILIVELVLAPSDLAWCKRWWDVINGEREARQAEQAAQ